MVDITVHPSCNMIMKDTLLPDEDQQHFLKTFQRALRWAHGENVKSVDLHLSDRTEPKYTNNAAGEQVCYDEGGWLEYSIVIRWPNERLLHIGAIQRKVGAESEFHS